MTKQFFYIFLQFQRAPHSHRGYTLQSANGLGLLSRCLAVQGLLYTTVLGFLLVLVAMLVQISATGHLCQLPFSTKGVFYILQFRISYSAAVLGVQPVAVLGLLPAVILGKLPSAGLI